MIGMGVVDRGLVLRSVGVGWRRTTGVIRARLHATPLLAWVHHRDVVALLVAAEMAEYQSVHVAVQMGWCGSRQRVRVRLGRYSGHVAAVEVERIGGPLPRGEWWVADYESLPPIPRQTWSAALTTL
jgi:hypothetical protein